MATSLEYVRGKIKRNGRVIETLPSNKAARARALEIVKAEAQGETAPPAAGIRKYVAVAWKNPLTIRNKATWSGSWNLNKAALFNTATSRPTVLERADLDLLYETEDGTDFGDAGAGPVRRVGTLDAMRHDDDVVDSAGAAHAAPCYTVRASDGGESVISQSTFGDLYEVVDTPRAAKKDKGAN